MMKQIITLGTRKRKQKDDGVDDKMDSRDTKEHEDG